MTKICFEDLFWESEGKPVEYCGRTIQLMDKFDIPEDASFELTFQETNSTWRQGIRLEVDGSFDFDGQLIEKSTVLWEDTAPSKIEFKTIESKKLAVWNVWDMGDGVTHSWHNGAAMVVHVNRRCRDYSCNDGKPNDDLNDLIFRLILKL